MAEGSTKFQIVNSVLLLGVLVTTTTMTCSNDRLEGRVIHIEKKLESVSAGGPGLSLPYASATDTIGDSTAPNATGGQSGRPRSSRVPGRASAAVATGWGGRSASITYVEGAADDAPLRLQDKPLPQGDWMVERRVGAPKTLNYYTTNEGECSQTIRFVLSTLFLLDPDHPPNIVPALATSWDVSDDKLSYTFHLRKGVQFADGRPFTSADVKFTFDVIRDAEVNAAHLAANFEDVEDVTAPDAYTVVFKFKRLYWKAVYAAGNVLRVLDKGWYEEQIPVYAKQNKIESFSIEPGKPGFGTVFRKIRIPCPGTGPYYLASDEDYTQERVILRHNPFCYYTQLQPTWWNLDQFRRVYVPDEVAADELFRKQEVDITVYDHERYETQIKNDPVVNRIANAFVYDHTGLGFNYINWNCRRPPFNDAKVRTAMTHLLDRQWVVDELYRGNATIAVCPTKRTYPTYSPELTPHAFDIEKAKKLLAEAGWTDTDGDGVLDREINGKRMRFEFSAKSSTGGGPLTGRILGAFQDACKKAGIRMDIELSEWSTFIKDFEQRRFDAAFLSAIYPDPWIDVYEDYHSSQDVPEGGNSSGWHDPKVDELLEKMRSEFDDAKRTEMFHEFNRHFYEAQPQTLIIHPLVRVLVNKRFEGATVRPTGMQNFDFWVKPENVLHR
jgi:peptide/nickel transport system substrate-binding protein